MAVQRTGAFLGANRDNPRENIKEWSMAIEQAFKTIMVHLELWLGLPGFAAKIGVFDFASWAKVGTRGVEAFGFDFWSRVS